MKLVKMMSGALLLFVTLQVTACNSTESSGYSPHSDTKKPAAAAPSTAHDNDDNARRITIKELKELYEKDKDSIVFVDTRTAAAYQASHIKGAILLGDFVSRASEIPKDKMIVTYCT